VLQVIVATMICWRYDNDGDE